MSSAIWLPAAIVLGAGLAVGALLAMRLRGTGAARQVLEHSDLQLRIRDLEDRRDDLYRRLRAADEEGLGDEERAALETAAARTLQELDRLGGQLQRSPEREMSSQKAARRQQQDAAPAVASAAPAGRGRGVLAGMAFGAGLMAIVAILIYWAVRDAQPKAEQTMQPTPSMEAPHEVSIEVPPEIADQITALQQRLETDPQDGMARKQLALAYIAAGQFFEAFEEASHVLQQNPEDPDALLVHGIVRLTMGQADQAVALLDRVLAQHPDHRQALIYRGLALYQMGDTEQALDTWEMGLQMIGGEDAELQELIRMALAGASPDPARPLPPPTSSAAASASTPRADLDGYAVQIQLAQGVRPTPQATLFVYLRSNEGGPPVAVRRIATPTFPLDLSLGAADSMMGAELPASGILVARLDADGNVATTSPTDLEAQSPASKGQVTLLRLAR